MALCEYEAKNGVAVLTLNNPPANPYSYEMFRDIDEGILKARFDPDVHVIVITGKGEKFFCAGADIEMLARTDPTYKYYFCLHSNETLQRLEQTPKLVIAAINGHCVGGGMEIALAADIRVARKDAGKIGLPEVKLGVLPGSGGTQRLPRIIGKSKAIELIVEAKTLTPAEAKEWGIVNKVFENEAFLEKVLEYARSFCPPGTAARAVGNVKRSIQSGMEMSFAEGLALERELQKELFASEDGREGFTAFVEKRTAKFKAR